LFSATWYWRWWLGFKVISLCWLWFLLRDWNMVVVRCAGF
jgi:hypothetical protein